MVKKERMCVASELLGGADLMATIKGGGSNASRKLTWSSDILNHSYKVTEK